MKVKARGTNGDLNGFLDAGSQLEGELRFDDTFRIDGRFHGVVRSDGDLIVGGGGEFDGEIEVGRVVVSGVVRGHVRARRLVEITAQGKVFAEIETPSLIVEDGAIFEGQCSMQPRAAAEPGAEGPVRTAERPLPAPVPLRR
jgi:cytoskeletal protein CcmA (bactofilin family)